MLRGAGDFAAKAQPVTGADAGAGPGYNVLDHHRPGMRQPQNRRVKIIPG